MNELRCPHCGTVGLEPGYAEDTGRQSFGFVRWVPGFLERTVFGVAKGGRLPRFRVDAFRCPTCFRLELYAAHQVP